MGILQTHIKHLQELRLLEGSNYSQQNHTYQRRLRWLLAVASIRFVEYYFTCPVFYFTSDILFGENTVISVA
jgi:hypothetical protein